MNKNTELTNNDYKFFIKLLLNEYKEVDNKINISQNNKAKLNKILQDEDNLRNYNDVISYLLKSLECEK